jgi:hypothetical protein
MRRLCFSLPRRISQRERFGICGHQINSRNGTELHGRTKCLPSREAGQVEAQLVLLGLVLASGTMATQDSSAVSISGGTLAGAGSGITALNAGNIASGTVGTARLGSGSASSSTYLRGDQTWAALVLDLPYGADQSVDFTAAVNTFYNLSGSHTASLPTVVGNGGKIIGFIMKGTGSWTLDPNGTETILGGLTYTFDWNQYSASFSRPTRTAESGTSSNVLQSPQSKSS